ncbi:MAG: hypothetical protein H7833_14450 [Magnetococcus sp. DMHC-1]
MASRADDPYDVDGTNAYLNAYENSGQDSNKFGYAGDQREGESELKPSGKPVILADASGNGVKNVVNDGTNTSGKRESSSDSGPSIWPTVAAGAVGIGSYALFRSVPLSVSLGSAAAGALGFGVLGSGVDLTDVHNSQPVIDMIAKYQRGEMTLAELRARVVTAAMSDNDANEYWRNQAGDGIAAERCKKSQMKGEAEDECIAREKEDKDNIPDNHPVRYPDQRNDDEENEDEDLYDEDLDEEDMEE